MSVRFYFSNSSNLNSEVEYEVDISNEAFHRKLGVHGYDDEKWSYLVMKKDAKPFVVARTGSPAEDNIAYFENMLGEPILDVKKPSKNPVTKLCINLLPRETHGDYLRNDNSFSHNYVLERDPFKVINMLVALETLGGHQFQSFVKMLNTEPEVTIIVEEGSPLTPKGLDFWNDIFMGELFNKE